MPNQLGQLADRGTTRALQTRFSLSPDYSLNLMPEVAAVIPFDMPELLFHQGWRRWMRGGQQAAVAAQNTQIRIGVRDSATFLVVLKSIIVSSAASDLVMTSGTAVGSTSLGTAFNGASNRDGRMSALANPNAEISATNTAAPFAASAFQISLPANTPFDVRGGPWILVPGTTITLQLQTVNVALNFGFVWRERLLQEQENTV